MVAAIFKFFSRLIGFFLFSALLIGGSIATNVLYHMELGYSDSSWANIPAYSPPGYNQTLYNVVLDQHSHTIYSDGVLTVRQNIEWHISMGYNCIVISDHDTMENQADINALKAEYLARGVIIIQGMEHSSPILHMNIIGLQEWTVDLNGTSPEENAQLAIDYAHSQDAVVTINHIPWSINQAHKANHPSRETILSWGVDYIEIVNDDSLPENVYDSESVIFCETNPIGQITGTDMHAPLFLASGAVHGWTLLHVDEFTEEAVMEELRNHRTTIIYDEVGLTDHGDYTGHPAYFWLRPLIAFGGIFLSLYRWDQVNWPGVAVYLLYLFGIFLIAEIYRGIKNQFWKKIHPSSQSINN
jgi:hypothetical protein